MPGCGGDVRIIISIEDYKIIKKIFDCLGYCIIAMIVLS